MARKKSGTDLTEGLFQKSTVEEGKTATKSAKRNERGAGRKRAADLAEGEKLYPMYIHVTEDVKKRFKLEAARTDKDMSHIIRDLARKHLPKE